MPNRSQAACFRSAFQRLRGRSPVTRPVVTPARRPFNLGESKAGTWEERAEAAIGLWMAAVAQMRDARQPLPNCWSILDLGCGDGKLARHLQATGINHRYQGFDLLPQIPACQQLDLAVAAPPVPGDIAFVLGVLEYLPDPKAFFLRLQAKTRYCVCSYVVADSGNYSETDWAARGWKHHLASSEVSASFQSAGFRQLATTQLEEGRTSLWLLTSRER